MKIGFVIDDTLDSTDGVQQYVLLLGEWLSDQGHVVHYLTGQSKRTDINKIHSLSRNVRVSFNKNRLSIPLPASSNDINKVLSVHNFDILHVQMPFSPLLAGKIIKLAKPSTAIVGTFHIAPHNISVKVGTKILGHTQSKSLKRFEQFISVSKVAQKFAKQTYGINSVIIPNAIDTKLWFTKKADRTIDIIFVGRLVKRKGCIFLLKALVELKKQSQFHNLKAVIVGDGPQLKMLKDFVEQNKLQSICKFEGYVTEQRKKVLLQSSKLAVYPSTGGESFGIVLIEAMASGTVVVAGNNPGYSSVLDSISGALFTPAKTLELAKVINDLLTSSKSYTKMHNDQQKLIGQYDVNTVGSAILNIYDKAVKSRAYVR